MKITTFVHLAFVCLPMTKLVQSAMAAGLGVALVNHSGTVNDYTHAQETHASNALIQSGYKPDVLEFAQDGNLFFTATKDGVVYMVTVTPSGRTFASTGIAE
jgi:hypothetical protein